MRILRQGACWVALAALAAFVGCKSAEEKAADSADLDVEPLCEAHIVVLDIKLVRVDLVETVLEDGDAAVRSFRCNPSLVQWNEVANVIGNQNTACVTCRFQLGFVVHAA